MAIHLSESDIRLLKELKAAGEHGRLIRNRAVRASAVRLVRVYYVTERAVGSDAARYSITARGRDAVDAMTIENG